MVKGFFIILGLAVLLYVFLTAPFMVECIRADGRHLIEIVGSDPCNVSHNSTHYLGVLGTDRQAITDPSESERPCTDRYASGPSYTRQSLYHTLSLKLFLVACDSARCADVIDHNHNGIGKEQRVRSSASSAKPYLRI